MKNKNIIIVIAVIIVIVGLAIIAKPRSNDNGSDSQEKTSDNIGQEENNGLMSDEMMYDFGTISMKDGDVSKMFKVTNTSDNDIIFPTLITSCMCTNAYFVLPDGSKKGPFGMEGMGYVPKLNETIPAGESRDIEVVYDPNAHGPAGVGMVDRLVILKDENGKELQFEIKVIVTP